MTRIEKMVRDLYIHKLVKNPKQDVSKCGYVINLQQFINGINDPINLMKVHMNEMVSEEK